MGGPGGGKETYGTWDQSLNLLPAMSRSTEPRPKQWILLAKSRYFWDFLTATKMALPIFALVGGLVGCSNFFFLVQKGWVNKNKHPETSIPKFLIGFFHLQIF